MHDRIFPPFLFGPVSYWKALMQEEQPNIGLGGSWVKQSHRNRFEISGPNKRQILSIPIKHESKHAGIKGIEISFRSRWQDEHIRSLDTAYLKSPFYEFYAAEVQAILQEKHPLLSQYLKNALNWVYARFTSEKEMVFSSEVPSVRDNDLVLKLKGEYSQNFSDRRLFDNNVCILDLLFNYGPESAGMLKRL